MSSLHLIRICCLACAWVVPLAAAAGPAATVALNDPPAEAIPEAEVQAAATQAVANGALALLERLHQPDNPKRLPYPPERQRRLAGYDEKQVPASWVTRKRPVYKESWEMVDRLMPKLVFFGPKTAYEMQKVRVLKERTKTGEEDYRELVPDPAGKETMTLRTPRYDQAGPALIPQGWYAVNARAFLVLARAGLGRRPEVVEGVRNLAHQLDNFGLPDFPEDLAWLTAGLALYAEDKMVTEMAKACAGRLLDGQMPAAKDAPAKGADALAHRVGGLWGPLVIDHEVQARFFDVELKVRAKAEEFSAKAAANPKDKAALEAASKMNAMVLLLTRAQIGRAHV